MSDEKITNYDLAPTRKSDKVMEGLGKQEKPIIVTFLKIPLSAKAIRDKFKGGFMKKVFRWLAVMILVLLPTMAMAIEMPDISVDGYLLYNLKDNTTTAAPGVSANIFTAFDGILEGNVGVAFPAQNSDATRSYVAGPILDVNIVQVLNRLKGVVITAKDLKFSAGIGVLVDIFHFNGNDLQQSVYPAAHLRFIF